MAYSIITCIASLFVLLYVLRLSQLSLGLPFAYLAGLLLIHVPGAYAHYINPAAFWTNEYVALGIYYAALASAFFVVGVIGAGFGGRAPPPVANPDRKRFIQFCFFGGLGFVYGLNYFQDIPSLGAAIEKGGAVWILGTMLGLKSAVKRGNPKEMFVWCAASMVYPVLKLVLGGFLSYGSAALIIIYSVLVVTVGKAWKVVIGIIFAVVFGMNLFVNYFQHREYIREEAWGGASLEDKLDASLSIVTDFQWFSTENPKQMAALDARLNQNYFVGLAAERLQAGVVSYLQGRSLWEGLIALVPRALWPDKPVYGGSPMIVAEMTGLHLSTTTSWGVGNVMEAQINFGTTGVIVSFLLFGFFLGKLDRAAALAERRADYGRLILYFLPAIAAIQPNGSIVEVTSGTAAAFIAAFGWRWAWQQLKKRPRQRTRPSVTGALSR